MKIDINDKDGVNNSCELALHYPTYVDIHRCFNIDSISLAPLITMIKKLKLLSRR